MLTPARPRPPCARFQALSLCRLSHGVLSVPHHPRFLNGRGGVTVSETDPCLQPDCVPDSHLQVHTRAMLEDFDPIGEYKE